MLLLAVTIANSSQRPTIQQLFHKARNEAIKVEGQLEKFEPKWKQRAASILKEIIPSIDVEGFRNCSSRILAIAIVIIELLPIISLTIPEVAADDPPMRNYSASISPTSASPLTNQDYTITITNSETSTKHLGSAVVEIPSIFTNLGTPTISSEPEGKSWVASLAITDNHDGLTISGNHIHLAAKIGKGVLAPGLSVSVQITVTNPGSSTCPLNAWTTFARENKEFEGPLFHLQGSQPCVSIVPTPTPSTIIIKKITIGGDGAFSFAVTGPTASSPSITTSGGAVTKMPSIFLERGLGVAPMMLYGALGGFLIFYILSKFKPASLIRALQYVPVV